LGLHYLLADSKNKKNIFITLTEDKDKLYNDAVERGFDLKKINFLDLSPSANSVEKNENYNVFPPSEVDQQPIIEKIVKKLKERKIDRIYFDGLTQLRYLSNDTFQFRKQILSLIQFATDQRATLIISSEASKNKPDDDLQFMCDGVINLSYDNNRRYIRVSKYRGSNFLSGKHSMKIKKDGIKIYPKLKLTKNRDNYNNKTFSSGISEIDKLLYGGIDHGSTTVITGASGVGKTTLGIQFIKEAASRGENSVVYTFEEDDMALLNRLEKINISIRKIVNQKNLLLERVDPLEYTSDEFAHKVKKEIKEYDAKFVMIDSISGYKLSFDGRENSQDEMVRNLHSLTNYLNNQGVTVIIINEMGNITGDFKVTELGMSYMADNIIFLRYLEIYGEIRKAIGVLKMRASGFENKMRDFKITRNGIKVGNPLTQLRGILTGSPESAKSSQKK